MKELRGKLSGRGWRLCGDEPMKITVLTKACGWLGTDLAEELERKGLVCEFADRDQLVLMPAPETDLARLEELLLSVEVRQVLEETPPKACRCQRVCSPREAMLAPSEEVPMEKALGRVLASPSVGCPPAVPIVLCGERVNEKALEAFRYYGITHCRVMK